MVAASGTVGISRQSDFAVPNGVSDDLCVTGCPQSPPPSGGRVARQQAGQRAPRGENSVQVARSSGSVSMAGKGVPLGGKNPVPSLTSGVGRASDQVVGVPPGKNLQGVPSGKNPGVGVPSGKNPSPVPRTMEESRQLADLAGGGATPPPAAARAVSSVLWPCTVPVASSALRSNKAAWAVRARLNLRTAMPPDNPLGPVHSDLCWAKIEADLADYPDRALLSSLRFGADLGYSGPCKTVLHKNHASALLVADQLEAQLKEELDSDWVAGGTARWQDLGLGDFFRQSPMGATAKRGSDRMRQIDDATFEGGINTDILDLPRLRFATVELVAKEVARLQAETGEEILLCKADLAQAYRCFPIRPQDWWLVGFSWKDLFYHHKRLNFGCRSSPAHFARLSVAICWAVAPLLPTGSAVVAYLDDFIIIGAASVIWEARRVLLELIRSWGLPVNERKLLEEGTPASSHIVLGIVVDCQKMELRIDAQRMLDIRAELDAWATRASCSKKQLQSLVGVLSFAARCVRPGRLHLRRMIQMLKCRLWRGNRTLSEGFCADLAWWRSFMATFNGVSAFPVTHPSRAAVISFCTDASGVVGYGGFCGPLYFYGRWTKQEKLGGHRLIGLQELATVIFGAAAFGEVIQGKVVRVDCDNQADVAVISGMSGRTPAYNSLLRELHQLSVDFDFELRAEHVPASIRGCLLRALKCL
jgi:hypothetical protein